jgi:hypothetical protein
LHLESETAEILRLTPSSLPADESGEDDEFRGAHAFTGCLRRSFGTGDRFARFRDCDLRLAPFVRWRDGRRCAYSAIAKHGGHGAVLNRRVSIVSSDPLLPASRGNPVIIRIRFKAASRISSSSPARRDSIISCAIPARARAKVFTHCASSGATSKSCAFRRRLAGRDGGLPVPSPSADAAARRPYQEFFSSRLGQDKSCGDASYNRRPNLQSP